MAKIKTKKQRMIKGEARRRDKRRRQVIADINMDAPDVVWQKPLPMSFNNIWIADAMRHGEHIEFLAYQGRSEEVTKFIRFALPRSAALSQRFAGKLGDGKRHKFNPHIIFACVLSGTCVGEDVDGHDGKNNAHGKVTTTLVLSHTRIKITQGI